MNSSVSYQTAHTVKWVCSHGKGHISGIVTVCYNCGLLICITDQAANISSAGYNITVISAFCDRSLDLSERAADIVRIRCRDSNITLIDAVFRGVALGQFSGNSSNISRPCRRTGDIAVTVAVCDRRCGRCISYNSSNVTACAADSHVNIAVCYTCVLCRIDQSARIRTVGSSIDIQIL